MDNEYLARHYQVSKPQIEDKVAELIELASGSNQDNQSFYRMMMMTIIKLIEEDTERWDVKIITQTLKELERSFTLLSQFKRRRKVTVYGSARTQPDDPDYQLAVKLGELLAKNNYMAITGAGGGVMEAAHVGAGVENSIGLNIDLPFEQSVNPIMEHDEAALLNYKFFFIRKLFFVKEADALVLFPGGFGTQDENFELLTLVQTGKSPVVPIILMDVENNPYWDGWLDFVESRMVKGGYISESDLSLIEHTNSAEKAIQIISKFYSNFHSSRWIGDTLYIRTQKELPDECIKVLNSDFKDICLSGSYDRSNAHTYEQDEPDLNDMHRISFKFNGRDCGRLREVINLINEY